LGRPSKSQVASPLHQSRSDSGPPGLHHHSWLKFCEFLLVLSRTLCVESSDRETISLDNPHSFFPLVDRLTDSQVLPNLHKLPPEAIHQGALGVAIDDGIIREPGDLGIVEMNLAMHAATPKLEAFYDYYEDTHNNSNGRECGSWVDWYGEVVCDVEGLAHLVGTEAIDADESPNKLYVSILFSSGNPTTHNFRSLSARPKLLTFDHIFPPPTETLERPPRTAILYASLFSPNFRELHTYLYTLVNKPDTHVEYVFRHIPPSTPSGAKNYLSGYGVALDLKKMDYLALDDRNLNNAGKLS